MHVFDGSWSDASVRLVVVWDGLAANAFEDLINTLGKHEEQQENVQQGEHHFPRERSAWDSKGGKATHHSIQGT
jgi:hypothetical protein